MATKSLERSTLYEVDFHAWARQQARLLREGRFADLDLENLAEKVEVVGCSDKRQIEIHLEVLLAPLLKWRFQPGSRTPSWRRTIREQRSSIRRLLDDSPSLAAYPEHVFSTTFAAAWTAAAEETGIDFTLFPGSRPFSLEQTIDPDLLPRSPNVEASP